MLLVMAVAAVILILALAWDNRHSPHWRDEDDEDV